MLSPRTLYVNVTHCYVFGCLGKNLIRVLALSINPKRTLSGFLIKTTVIVILILFFQIDSTTSKNELIETF